MNNNVKILIGAAIGAGVGYFVGSVVAEIIAIREDPYRGHDEYYEDEYPNTDDGGPEIDETDGKEVFKRSDNMSKQKTKKRYDEMYNDRPELEDLIKKYQGQLEENPQVVDPENVEEFDEPEDADIQPISIISVTEFANAEGFQTLTLNYYDDDVVTDQHENPIDHPEQLLGEDALVSFGELSDDPDVVYVRNLEKKAMYEVVRTNTTYAGVLTKNRRLHQKAQLKQPRRDRIDSMGEEEVYGEDNT